MRRSGCTGGCDKLRCRWPVAGRRIRSAPSTGRTGVRSFELVVIGCSLGGMRVLQTVLGALPESFSVPIAVVQHRHKASNEGLPAFLRKTTKLRVVDVEDKLWIKSGTVYLAPADYHLLVERGTFSLSVDDRVSYS